MEKIQLISLGAGCLIFLSVILFAIKKMFIRKNNTFKAYDEVQAYEEDQLEYARTLGDDSYDDEEIVEQERQLSEHDHFIMISIHAKPGRIFSDYHFIQALGANGLEYGDHKIFHYDVKTDIGVQRLFSVAQLNKPGSFDLNDVKNIYCKGLLFFIDLRQCRKRALALDCMIETAYQLADDLDGIMFDGYNAPWHDEIPHILALKLEQYQKNLASVLDETTY